MKRILVEPDFEKISITRQCQRLGLPRSSYYYRPADESPFNLELMRLLDEQYIRTPFYGVPRMTAWLKTQGYHVGPKRIRRLMRKMEITAIFPKPNTSKPGQSKEKYPYLLQSVVINRPNQVWSTDITYIRLKSGFVYLCAILDWFSRYVLAWELSNSQEVTFCMKTLEKALGKGNPDIFNSDQGRQFTSEVFTKRLKDASIAISHDGRGRVFDNIFVERLWRTVKYEEVYLHEYQSVMEAFEGLERYFRFYNEQRLHQSLGYLTPEQVHFGQKPIPISERKGGKPME